MKKTKEQNFLERLRNADSVDHADAPPASSGSVVQLAPGKYLPPFNAQIQIQLLKNYWTENGAGVYATVLPAVLPVAAQVSLPFFLFAQSDFASGYAKQIGQNSVNTWVPGTIFVVGKDQPVCAFGTLTSTVTATLRRGDVVMPWTCNIAAQNYLALTILRASDVAYSTLLDASSSNSFKINLLRYTVNSNQLTQYSERILAGDLTMFGKFTSDPINPESFQNPDQQLPYVTDIDIVIQINKEKGLSTYTLYDVLTVRWNLFIDSVTKIV